MRDDNLSRDLVPAAGPVDVAAIAARALAAPIGTCEAYPHMMRIDWTAPDDDTVDGRYIGILEGDWHGSEQPPAALWEFLAAAKDDVLALVAHARWWSDALVHALAAETVARGQSAPREHA